MNTILRTVFSIIFLLGFLLVPAVVLLVSTRCLSQTAEEDRKVSNDKYVLDDCAVDLALIMGDLSCIKPITQINPSYFNANPAFAFLEQQNDGALHLLLDSGTGKSKREFRDDGPPKRKNDYIINDQLLFANRSFSDLILELAKTEAPKDNKRLTLSSQKLLNMSLYLAGEKRFQVEENGDYEVWIANRGLSLIAKTKQFFLIGEIILPVPPSDISHTSSNYCLWTKEGDVALQRGEYKVYFADEIGESYAKGGPSTEPCDLEFIFVSKEMFAKYASVLYNERLLGYLYYISLDKTKELIKQTRDPHKHNANPFCLPKEQFYVPQDQNYSAKAYITPKRNFMPVDVSLTSIDSNETNAVLETLTGWDVQSENVVYEQSLSNKGLQIKTYFSKKGNVPEKVTLSKRFSGLTLMDIPYIVISCLTGNTEVQEAELIIYVRDKDGEETTKDVRLLLENKIYCGNLYEEVAKVFDKSYYKGDLKKFFIEGIDIVFKKKLVETRKFAWWDSQVKTKWVDASSADVRGNYTFTLKNVSFPNYLPTVVQFEGTRVAYPSPEYLYYLDENGQKKTALFFEEIPANVKNVYRLGINDYVDLGKTPSLTFSFKKLISDYKASVPLKHLPPEVQFPYYLEDRIYYEPKTQLLTFEGLMSGEERDTLLTLSKDISYMEAIKTLSQMYRYSSEEREFPTNFRILLGLDFDDDRTQDAEMELFGNIVPMTVDCSFMVINAYEEVKRKFPGKEHYNMLSLSVSHPNEKTFVTQECRSKKIIRCKVQTFDLSGFVTNLAVLKIDDKAYTLPRDHEKYVHNGTLRIEFNDIALKSGIHTVEAVDNKEFTVEAVEISPKLTGRGAEPKKIEPPTLEFKKINPTRYVVCAKNVKSPFILELNESFHPLWEAYIRQTANKYPATEPWSALWSTWNDWGKRMKIEDHFALNGYANGWIIPATRRTEIKEQSLETEDKNVEGNSLQIVLEYKPQMYFEAGVFLSAIILMVLTVYSGYNTTRKRKNIAGEN